MVFSTTVLVAPTGMTSSPSVSGLTGSLVIPSPTTSTGTGIVPTHTGAASTVRIESCAAVLIGVAGFFMTM